MRWFLALPMLSVLALPVTAQAQDQSGDSAGAPAGQYQPGTLPPEPPVIEPPLPGQSDNMAPPPGPDDSQPPLPGQDASGADGTMPPPGPDDSQPPPPPGAYGAPPGPDTYQAGKPDRDAAMRQKMEARFDAANTTHDGRLTLQQAEDANMRGVVKHFSQIDTQHLGYVTFNELMAWRMDQMAQQMERRAAALRAQQGQ